MLMKCNLIAVDYNVLEMYRDPQTFHWKTSTDADGRWRTRNSNYTRIVNQPREKLSCNLRFIAAALSFFTSGRRPMLLLLSSL